VTEDVTIRQKQRKSSKSFWRIMTVWGIHYNQLSFLNVMEISFKNYYSTRQKKFLEIHVDAFRSQYIVFGSKAYPKLWRFYCRSKYSVRKSYRYLRKCFSITIQCFPSQIVMNLLLVKKSITITLLFCSEFFFFFFDWVKCLRHRPVQQSRSKQQC